MKIFIRKQNLHVNKIPNFDTTIVSNPTSGKQKISQVGDLTLPQI